LTLPQSEDAHTVPGKRLSQKGFKSFLERLNGREDRFPSA
jgi:hypothetical protein